MEANITTLLATRNAGPRAPRPSISLSQVFSHDYSTDSINPRLLYVSLLFSTRCLAGFPNGTSMSKRHNYGLLHSMLMTSAKRRLNKDVSTLTEITTTISEPHMKRLLNSFRKRTITDLSCYMKNRTPEKPPTSDTLSQR